MSQRHQVGPDVDLDAEDVRDRQGRRITTEYAERASEEAYRSRGRAALPSVPPGRRPHECRSGYPNRHDAVRSTAPGRRADRCPTLPAKRWTVIWRERADQPAEALPAGQPAVAARGG